MKNSSTTKSKNVKLFLNLAVLVFHIGNVLESDCSKDESYNFDKLDTYILADVCNYEKHKFQFEKNLEIQSFFDDEKVITIPVIYSTERDSLFFALNVQVCMSYIRDFANSQTVLIKFTPTIDIKKYLEKDYRKNAVIYEKEKRFNIIIPKDAFETSRADFLVSFFDYGHFFDFFGLERMCFDEKTDNKFFERKESQEMSDLSTDNLQNEESIDSSQEESDNNVNKNRPVSKEAFAHPKSHRLAEDLTAKNESQNDELNESTVESKKLNDTFDQWNQFCADVDKLSGRISEFCTSSNFKKSFYGQTRNFFADTVAEESEESDIHSSEESESSEVDSEYIEEARSRIANATINQDEKEVEDSADPKKIQFRPSTPSEFCFEHNFVDYLKDRLKNPRDKKEKRARLLSRPIVIPDEKADDSLFEEKDIRNSTVESLDLTDNKSAITPKSSVFDSETHFSQSTVDSSVDTSRVSETTFSESENPVRVGRRNTFCGYFDTSFERS